MTLGTCPLSSRLPGGPPRAQSHRLTHSVGTGSESPIKIHHLPNFTGKGGSLGRMRDDHCAPGPQGDFLWHQLGPSSWDFTLRLLHQIQFTPLV